LDLRPGNFRILKFTIRILVIWAIQTVALLIMARLMPTVTVTDARSAIVAAAVIGLLNALLWPILTYVLLPLAVYTFGIFTLILNGVLIWLASELLPGFDVTSIGAGIVLTIGLTLITTILSSLLTINDDNSYYRNVIRRRAKKAGRVFESDVPGVLFLEVDGLALPILKEAIRDGNAVTMAKWISSGSHKLEGWETDLSSQTSASQAGILLGNNSNIPAFRWYDRKTGQIVSSSSPKFVSVLEKQLSNGEGLLAAGGGSVGNLFSGDAPEVMTTASTMTDMSRLHTKTFYPFFSNPYNFTRTLLLFVWDVLLEMWQAREARRKNIQPRLDKHHRGGKYPLVRAGTTIIMRELNMQTAIGAAFAGIPSLYATFVGYDEVAHHSGVTSSDALNALKKLDEQFARLEVATKSAPRPYHLVLLSDHGQTGGATFKQRYSISLEDYVRSLAQGQNVLAKMEMNEDWGHINLYMSDAVSNQKADSVTVNKAVNSVVKNKEVDGEVVLGPDGKEPAQPQADIIVLASGNLGLIYFTQWKQRMTREQIEEAFPEMLPGLVNHPGVGFVMVRSEQDGPLAIGSRGVFYLAQDRYEGENPLAPFGENAARHLCRTDSFEDAPDILVNSFYDPKTNEGAAFEELIGFHGGLGGTQTQPFVMYPSSLEGPTGPIIGAEALHHVMKKWVPIDEGEPTTARVAK
jgi:putative membrane protein